MIMLNRFNVMAVRNKKPLTSWRYLVNKEQNVFERKRIIAAGNKSTIGVICGPVSNIFVLDDDGSKELKNYRIPRTATVNTPRGGKHYYFKWIPELDSKVTTGTDIFDELKENGQKGVDSRGHGGYVVWYGWENPPNLMPFARPPQWLIDLLPNKKNPWKIADKPAIAKREIADKPTAAKIVSAMREGNRDDSFTRIAGGLRARGYGVEAMFELLKPKAREVGFTEEELYKVCRSVGRYKPNIMDSSADEAITLTTQILSEKLHVQWFVEPQIISKQSVTFLAGLPEAGKTWMLMDLALALATGTKWLGLYPCRRLRTIYLDQERSRASTVERFNALIAGRNLTPGQLDDTLLLKPQSRFKFNITRSFESFDRLLTAFRPDVVLVDSFKRIHSNNELSSQDMQALFTRVEELKDKYGCAFVFIHHETKSVIARRSEKFSVRSTDAAGTIDIQQTAEHFFNAVEVSSGSMLYHTKNNFGPKGSPRVVKIVDLLPDRSKISVRAY